MLRSVWLAHATDRPMINAVAAIEALSGEVLQDLVQAGTWAVAWPLQQP